MRKNLCIGIFRCTVFCQIICPDICFSCRSCLLYLIFHSFNIGNGVFPCTDNLIAINQTGYEEIDDGLCPKGKNLGANVV